MTLFQAIVAALVGVITEFFPLSPAAHTSLLESILGWNISAPQLQGAIELGLCLALIFVLRHDFFSHVSSLITLLVYRKKPMAMDERMPLFVMTSLIFPVVGFFFLKQLPIRPSDQPLLFAAIFGLSGLPMAFFDFYMKKSKSIYDWNFLDALIVGFGASALVLPEVGRVTGFFTLAALRGFSREGASKFSLFLATPLLGLSAWYHLKGPGADLAISEFPDLYFYVVVGVSVLSGVFMCQAFLSQIKTTALSRYAFYRVFVGMGTLAYLWYNR